MLPGMPPVVFTPAPMAFVEVCEPDDVEALTTLALVFGQPEHLGRLDGLTGEWWRCPEPTAATVDRHLRDMHRTQDRGTTSHLTGSVNESLTYHYQIHRQVLVHPLPVPHFHDREI